jgi:hypothetical protein
MFTLIHYMTIIQDYYLIRILYAAYSLGYY